MSLWITAAGPATQPTLSDGTISLEKVLVWMTPAFSIPPDRAETCLSAIANTAGSLGLDSSAEESTD